VSTNGHEAAGIDPTFVLPGLSTTEIRAARRFVEREVGSRVTHHVAAAMQLATSELVTNALQHGLPGSVIVTVHVNDERSWVRVAGESPLFASLPPEDQWAISNAASLTGRGLGIVKAISDRVRVVRQGRHLAITVSFRL
jgi:anti-sigma regulatory factor (Ser/Thr protein kinase)